MATEVCPNCGSDIPAPGGSHGMLHEVPHSNRDCPGCGRPVIWFTEGQLATGWRIDETEERRQKLRTEDALD
jgi:ribosomal protein S27AE